MEKTRSPEFSSKGGQEEIVERKSLPPWKFRMDIS
jgi:hypothetical protein